MKFIFPVSLALALLLPNHSKAVSLSDNHQGEVLLFPYYTVNNNLNTIYSVINLSPDPKVIKVKFLEGENGVEVLGFNVYLDRHDVWSGALAPITASSPGHAGEDSVIHMSSDQSCVPFLDKTGQEFLPFLLDNNPNNNDLQRARDGHIEVIEMGVVTDDQAGSATAISHDTSGIPTDCNQLEQAWDSNGYWDVNPDTDISAPTGSLMGTASLIDVSNGVSFDYNAVALNDFWDDIAEHTDPGNLLPNLASGSKESQILMNNELVNNVWPNGFEAVSAVFMTSKIVNEYNIEPDVLSGTEWVVSFPTKNYHVNTGFQALPPFTQTWDQFVACHEFQYKIYDRETITNNTGIIGPPPPQGANPSLCFQTNVVQFIKDSSNPNALTDILSSNKQTTLAVEHTNDTFTTLSGWAEFDFTSYSDVNGYVGLPAIGFQVQKFSNTTSENLTATYGTLNTHKSTLEE